MLATAGPGDQAAIGKGLLDELHHVPVWYRPQQLQVEASVPHGVVCGSQVQGHYPSLLIVLEDVLDVLSKKCNLVCC